MRCSSAATLLGFVANQHNVARQNKLDLQDKWTAQSQGHSGMITSARSTCRKWLGLNLNPNVRLTLWWTWVETASSSIRSGDVLSAFIYLRTGDNSVVGYIQGVNGAMQLLLAVPAGWLADRYRRDAVLRGAAAVGAVAAAFMGWVLFTDAPVWSLYVALGLIGGYRGFNNPAIESIFSDSVATGQSSALYTAKSVVINLSSTCGPLISILLFIYLGNTWEADTCRLVLLAGLITMLLPLALMCFFDDDNTLGLLSESLQENLSYQSLGEAERQAPKAPWSPLGPWTIPVLVSFSDLVSALASGMTIKFFSLFFFEVVGLGPVYVSAISLVMPLGISWLSLTLQHMTGWFHRMHLTIVTRAADVGLLVGMAYMPTSSRGAGHALVAAHILRSSFANASRPLLRSVLMDNDSEMAASSEGFWMRNVAPCRAQAAEGQVQCPGVGEVLRLERLSGSWRGADLDFRVPAHIPCHSGCEAGGARGAAAIAWDSRRQQEA